MGRRLALLIATYDYRDAGLRRLESPAADIEALAAVLQDPKISGFDVSTLINEPHYVVGEAIGDFYRGHRRDDLTLLYFTGHGLKDEDGRLYLAMNNTRRDSLLFTALPAEQLDQAMQTSRSRQVVLILDCCYSGAFPAGRVAKADTEVHSLETLQARGRTVLTASDAMQYSFEGEQLHGGGARSVFTRCLVEGLRDGSADLDSDGNITLDELYAYVYDRVIEEMPQQRPKKQDNVEGRLIVARNINWQLPDYLRHALESPIATERLAALDGLERLYRIGSPTVREYAIGEMRRLTDDDSRMVSTNAIKRVIRLQPETERERAERDRAEREQAERGRAERERAERDRAEREQAERERAERERAARDRAEREQAERERAERERAERERVERERVEREQAVRERAERERAEQARPVEQWIYEIRRTLDKKPTDGEEGARQGVESERAKRERVERERAEQAQREQAERERAKRERAERAQREQAERERTERERAEQAQREQAERERVERERVERERAERVRAEQARPVEQWIYEIRRTLDKKPTDGEEGARQSVESERPEQSTLEPVGLKNWNPSRALRRLLDDEVVHGQRPRNSQIERAIACVESLGDVRIDEIDDATKDRIIILADHFGVPEAYFTDGRLASAVIDLTSINPATSSSVTPPSGLRNGQTTAQDAKQGRPEKATDRKTLKRKWGGGAGS